MRWDVNPDLAALALAAGDMIFPEESPFLYQRWGAINPVQPGRPQNIRPCTLSADPKEFFL